MSVRARLFSQSTVIFGARIFGAGLTFLLQVAIARLFGADVLGEYILVMASVNIIAVVLPLGFEATGTYFAAEYRAKGEGLLLRGFMLRAYLHIAICGALLLAAGNPVASLFGASGRLLAAHWAPAVLLCMATAVVYVSGAMLVGLKRPYAGYFADSLFRPLLAIAGFSIALSALSGATGRLDVLLWVLALGYALVGVGQFVLLWRSVADIPIEVAPRRAEWRRWWHFAVPWMALAVAGDFFFDIDLLLLAGHLPTDELAVFGVCTRIFSLVSFGVAAVYAVNLPDMFESEAMKDRAGFLRKIREANFAASGLALVLLVGVVVGSPIAFMFFGPAFQAGVGPLTILCVGLVLRAMLGPASIMLSVHNRPYASLPAVAAAMTTLVVANFALAPPFGLMGAAVAALLGMIVWSGALWFTALKVAGVDVSIGMRPGRSAKALIARPVER